jgi:hypothetical protein
VVSFFFIRIDKDHDSIFLSDLDVSLKIYHGFFFLS